MDDRPVESIDRIRPWLAEAERVEAVRVALETERREARALARGEAQEARARRVSEIEDALAATIDTDDESMPTYAAERRARSFRPVHPRSRVLIRKSMRSPGFTSRLRSTSATP